MNKIKIVVLASLLGLGFGRAVQASEVWIQEVVYGTATVLGSTEAVAGILEVYAIEVGTSNLTNGGTNFVVLIATNAVFGVAATTSFDISNYPRNQWVGGPYYFPTVFETITTTAALSVTPGKFFQAVPGCSNCSLEVVANNGLGTRLLILQTSAGDGTPQRPGPLKIWYRTRR